MITENRTIDDATRPNVLVLWKFFPWQKTGDGPRNYDRRLCSSMNKTKIHSNIPLIAIGSSVRLQF